MPWYGKYYVEKRQMLWPRRGWPSKQNLINSSIRSKQRQKYMTTAGLEPAPFRTAALTRRLRPLGQVAPMTAYRKG